MSSKHVRAENTTIRPFRNIGAANVALDEVRLLVDDEEERPGPVVLAPGTLADSKLTLVLPDVDLAIPRLSLSLAAVAVLLFGFIWDLEQ